MNKPRLSFWQIWNMSFGFLGIQFGWALQMANMSAIYEFLGAEPERIPILWLAAPLTGLIVQPIIGHMSDRTWNRLGRRRPYFLVGAILSSLALVAMPNSSSLWMAAGLLWILDASINISMEPFRAFVADKLPEGQRSQGFAMQSLMIGLGAIVASALPWMMTNWFGVTSADAPGSAIPASVKYAFYLGAVAFFAAVLWTIVSSPEYPPEDLEAFRRSQREHTGVGRFFREITGSIGSMPATMRQLAWVQVFTWLGLFCMWLYAGPAVARGVFQAPDETSDLYRQGIEFWGLVSSYQNLVTFVFAFLLLALARRLSRKFIHTFCLACGAAGLVSIALIKGVDHRHYLLLSMTGVGIAWASILSMPYAMLAGALPPERMGIYMGIFNFFIVLPEIAASLFFGWIMSHLLNGNRMAAVVVGGCSMGLAALLVQRVQDRPGPTAAAEGAA